jgi:two-component sensor histidine kinase
MTNNKYLDILLLTFSIFNVIILFGLSLTVFLTSETKKLGVKIASLGLFSGGLFFIFHTIIITLDNKIFNTKIDYLWFFSWILLIILPYAWYSLILWYLGFWEKGLSDAKKKHSKYLILINIFFIVLLFVCIFLPGLPSFDEFILLKKPNSKVVEFFLLIYPVYIFLCIFLSIKALDLKVYSHKFIGTLAKEKAKIWLRLSTIMLFIVSIMVSGFILWFVFNSNSFNYDKEEYLKSLEFITFINILIEIFISLTIIFLGKAITSYEIFTGKALPAKSVFESWRGITTFASSYSFIISIFAINNIESIYYVLFSSLSVVSFYAFFSRKNYLERENFFRNLRPAINKKFLDKDKLNIKDKFYYICNQILKSEKAILVPLGMYKVFFGDFIVYPEDIDIKVKEIVNKFNFREESIIETPGINDFFLGIKLHNDKEDIALLILGKKLIGGLYSREEIEITRTVIERILDTDLTNEIINKLLDIQKNKIVENQLIDRFTRRILHDDVLPLLHSSIIEIKMNNFNQGIELIQKAHKKISNMLKEIPTTTNYDISKLGFIDAIKLFVKNELSKYFDKIEWKIDNDFPEIIKSFSNLVQNVLFYAIVEIVRNSSKYARCEDKDLILNIEFKKNYDNIQISITDNGIGYGYSKVKNKGSGNGLILHSTLMLVIGGKLDIESEKNNFTKVILSVPFSNS